MKITCLVDNLGSNNKRLKPENGLSYFIEKGDHKILFDTGSNDALVKNAKTLGIDLALVESVIISHGHYDHGGGLPAFFRVNKSAKVYIKESAFGPFFHDHQLFSRYIGLPTKKLNQFRDRFDLLDAPSEIGENIFIVTQIKQVEAVTHFNQGLSIEKDREFVPDTFLHELFVIILENSKLNIFTGCGHSNVLNMLRMTKKIFPDYPIKSLFGGFHLKKPEKYSVEEQILIREIASKLENYNIEKIYTNHCTGLAGFDLLKEVLGEKIEYFGLGSSAEI